MLAGQARRLLAMCWFSKWCSIGAMRRTPDRRSRERLAPASASASASASGRSVAAAASSTSAGTHPTDASDPRNVKRDTDLSAPQLIAAYNYPVEVHKVTTEDGYVLTLHRIPRFGPRRSKVVFLQHGVLSSSFDWLVMGPGKALAYLLSDAGFDVWMGNARGNMYSKERTKLVPENKYWSFSFHEMGVYDLPAVIDYVLKTTNSQQLHYVGHSMGTTMFYVMGSERPLYNDKVRVMVSLAPVAYVSNMKSGLLKMLATFGNTIGDLMLKHGLEEFDPSPRLKELARTTFCKEDSITQELCSNVLFLIAGYDSEQLDRKRLPVILSHVPAGTSTTVFIHYGQIANTGKFHQLDQGEQRNKQRYGRPQPPPYNLARVTAPVALFTGDNDNLVADKDLSRLQKELGNVIGHFRVPYPPFNHLDFLWAKDAKELLYNDIIQLLQKW